MRVVIYFCGGPSCVSALLTGKWSIKSQLIEVINNIHHHFLATWGTPYLRFSLFFSSFYFLKNLYYSCFKMFCQLLPYSKVTPVYLYIHSFFPHYPPATPYRMVYAKVELGLRSLPSLSFISQSWSASCGLFYAMFRPITVSLWLHYDTDLESGMSSPDVAWVGRPVTLFNMASDLPERADGIYTNMNNRVVGFSFTVYTHCVTHYFSWIFPWHPGDGLLFSHLPDQEAQSPSFHPGVLTSGWIPFHPF